jgi:hypothetical protein
MKENKMQASDTTVRHFIYQTFAKTASPPTASQIAGQFKIPKHEAEDSLERLADAHQIALAPGSHNIWMAHPFSGLKTDFVTRVDGKTYWGN